MKILISHSDPKLPARESIDLWRIIRPFRELAKHTDWQIDHTDYPINPALIGSDNKVETDKLVKEIERLGKYNIVWSGYFPDAVLFDVMTFVQQKYGTKFVLDTDDDVFHIPSDNSIWSSAGFDGVQDLKYIVKEAPYVVTSSENLKAEFDRQRDGKPTYLLPNYIGSDFKHPKFINKDKIVISFFGSITHRKDLTDTGFVEALGQIMHKYKNVYVETVGCNISTYLPKQRYSHNPGKPGQAYIDEVWPSINCDIAVAPLRDNQFNRCRSNIKWLEASMIPAAFVASNIPPYKGSVESGKTGLLVNNDSESWFEALEALVTDKTLRQNLAKAANKEVIKNWTIENKWPILKEIIENISS